uniref:P-type ATPase A domain-containing protein n=1 Tax=Megaselia scalaris TaxID=36166 RepID=T1GC36_MEGSC
MKTVYSNDHAIVLHENGETELTETRYLVPGDIIEIPPHGCTMQCDAVLLSGNCIVDEALLTGESVPVTKTMLPLKRGVQFDLKEHNRHVLFSGTRVLQTRYIGSEKVLARVISTGDTTAKGSLIRSILYPPPVDYKFEQDSYKFIALLAAIAGIGFTYSLTQKILNNIDPIKLAVESLDLITIVVPPALPAAMTVGRFYAQKRLEKGKIFCISPRSINVAGSIDLVCFDKTGTLTEDGLDMWGVVTKEMINGERRGDPLDLKMFESTNWELEDVGVPDEKMFDVLYPVIVKPKDIKESPKTTTLSSSLDDLLSSLPDNPSIGIVREFPFASSLQRMSVITRSLSASHFTVYAKGSPEIIHALSKPESLPRDFYEQLDVYARKGLRVIALAFKPLDKKLTYAKVQKVPRDQIECELTFLGFVILENRLKPETTEIIRQLTASNIRSVMVTGDNILTAVSVARDCGILCRSENVITVTTKKKDIYYTATPSEQLGSFSSLDTCLTTTESWKGVEAEGKTWEVIRDNHPDILPKIVARGSVFARMSPDQKQELIVELQSLGHYVGMCGDGANDCGALKAAHAGISLSQAESSVASPFTSHEPTIACVPKVIKEGRCALVTSFGIFKFMAAYSLVS